MSSINKEKVLNTVNTCNGLGLKKDEDLPIRTRSLSIKQVNNKIPEEMVSWDAGCRL